MLVHNTGPVCPKWSGLATDAWIGKGLHFGAGNIHVSVRAKNGKIIFGSVQNGKKPVDVILKSVNKKFKTKKGNSFREQILSKAKMLRGATRPKGVSEEAFQKVMDETDAVIKALSK